LLNWVLGGEFVLDEGIAVAVRLDDCCCKTYSLRRQQEVLIKKK
jgi:hypothetical protein